jgi:hypothetical protein
MVEATDDRQLPRAWREPKTIFTGAKGSRVVEPSKVEER